MPTRMGDVLSLARFAANIKPMSHSTEITLEMIRRETSDSSVQTVANILLVNSYLEQGNYAKAQNFLNDAFKNFKANNANSSLVYSAVAGQVVKGARNQLDRYRALGLMVSDRNLPLEAVNDIEKMRDTLELVITQTKELSANKTQSVVTMPILDESTFGCARR